MNWIKCHLTVANAGWSLSSHICTLLTTIRKPKFNAARERKMEFLNFAHWFLVNFFTIGRSGWESSLQKKKWGSLTIYKLKWIASDVNARTKIWGQIMVINITEINALLNQQHGNYVCSKDRQKHIGANILKLTPYDGGGGDIYMTSSFVIYMYFNVCIWKKLKRTLFFFFFFHLPAFPDNRKLARNWQVNNSWAFAALFSHS